MTKRVVITGHTQGIGAALKKVFEENGFIVDGFSRYTGYDISKHEIREEILSKSYNADIFINNAYDAVGQFLLLRDIVSRWEGTSKLVINIGSKGVHIPVVTPYDEYLSAKRKQHKFIQSRFLKGSPRILNVIGGLVDTNINKHWDVKKLKAEDFAQMVYFLATSDISVQEVMLDVPGIDWGEIWNF